MHTQPASRPGPISRSSIMLGDPRNLRSSEAADNVETLPFTVRLASGDHDLRKAAHIRQQAYTRHLPEVGAKLSQPEAIDALPDSAVLLAESKVDGSALGTVRVQTNRHQALALESALRLPAWLEGARLAHISRLGVAQGAMGRLVKLVLFKGLFQYWERNEIEWAVVAARSPLDRMYEQLLFVDVFPTQGYIPLPHMGDIPHRVMAFEVATARRRWRQTGHPLYDFMVNIDHPDLIVTHDRTAARASPVEFPTVDTQPIHGMMASTATTGRRGMAQT